LLGFVWVDMDMGGPVAGGGGLSIFEVYFDSTTVKLWLYDLEETLGTLALFTV
jgi:hypothetical protein